MSLPAISKHLKVLERGARRPGTGCSAPALPASGRAAQGGGVWRYVMHSTEFGNFPNKVVYLEVAKPERLVYDQGADDDTFPDFRVTVTFADKGKQTELTMRAVFPTAAARDKVVREFGAIEGGKQTLDRLGEFLEQA